MLSGHEAAKRIELNCKNAFGQHTRSLIHRLIATVSFSARMLTFGYYSRSSWRKLQRSFRNIFGTQFWGHSRSATYYYFWTQVESFDYNEKIYKQALASAHDATTVPFDITSQFFVFALLSTYNLLLSNIFSTTQTWQYSSREKYLMSFTQSWTTL